MPMVNMPLAPKSWVVIFVVENGVSQVPSLFQSQHTSSIAAGVSVSVDALASTVTVEMLVMVAVNDAIGASLRTLRYANDDQPMLPALSTADACNAIDDPVAADAGTV